MKIATYLCLLFVCGVLGVQCLDVYLPGVHGNNFKIENVVEQSQNPDGSTTFTCKQLQLNIQGRLTVIAEKHNNVRVIQSDGVCKVNECNMPPMRDMVFNLNTGFNTMCQQTNTNEMITVGGIKTCSWLNNDCEKSPACKPMDSIGQVEYQSDNEVKVTLKCGQINAEFYCNKNLPNVWYVKSMSQHGGYFRVVKRIECQTVIPMALSSVPCRKVKKVKHSHYSLKNRVVTYSCKEGYQQKGRVNQYTCDTYSGKWNNVNMKCEKLEKHKKLSVLEIVLLVLGIIGILVLVGIFVICKCLCEVPCMCC